MIYTRFFTPVKLLTSELVHEQDADGRWLSIYYVTAEQSAPNRDGSGEIGGPILGGQQFAAAELKADEGWSEIMEAVQGLLLADNDPAHEPYDPKRHLAELDRLARRPSGFGWRAYA